ncbi:DUF6886 family protein [Paenibacillus sp. y28]|uniref:DUF6886 family protein n=1 Tax=Paenibacillus sp. y28 TaxID=3129110 RepID=UPI003018B677
MLFHFSENPDIEVFVPKQIQSRPGFPAVVWAIDEEQEFTYYFPRECPRIVCRRTRNTSEEHRELFFKNTDADIIVTVENEWYPAIAKQRIYKYHFAEAGFELFDRTAGYYISVQTVRPAAVEAMDNLIGRLLGKNIELRFTSSLYPLREAIVSSGYEEFGIHRFSNARK